MNEANMGFNKFCGPAVLSIMTGHDTDECAYRISCVNGQHTVTGVHLQDLMQAGKAMGVQFEMWPYMEGRSLFFAASVMCKFKTKFLVIVANHYIMLESDGEGQIFLCDNHTITPIDLKNSARLSQKIVKVVKVDTSNVKPPAPKPPKPTFISHKYDVRYAHGLVNVTRQNHMSDNSIEYVPAGSFQVLSIEDLQEIAFAIMELTK